MVDLFDPHPKVVWLEDLADWLKLYFNLT